MKHTIKYYEQKYREYVNYTINEGIENNYDNVNEFISAYEEKRGEGSKNVMKDLKYFARHKVSYKTARAMLQKAREFGGTEKLRELQDINTNDFAARYIDELREEQKQAKSKYGIYGNDFGGYLGVMWFGSE